MSRILPQSWPGVLIVIGVAVRLINVAVAFLAGGLPRVLAALDVAAAIAIAAGAGYFLVRALTTIKRRLLWRVRRKLIISYIFIGFVPVMLVAAFFLLGGVLLFFNFSAYLVRSEFRSLREQARILAHDVAVDIERAGPGEATAILRRRHGEIAKQFPNASLALVAVDRDCGAEASGVNAVAAAISPPVVAGSWPHVEPPASIPPWIHCEGFGGLFVYGPALPSNGDPDASLVTAPPGTGMVVRGVGFPEISHPRYAVTVDLIVDAAVGARMRDAIGAAPERVTQVNRAVGLLPARSSGAAAPIFTGQLPLSSIARPQYHDWHTGTSGPLTAAIALSITEIYGKITAGAGEGDIGNIVLFLLQIVGAMFLVLEALALLVGLTLAKSITGSVHELFTGTERVRRGDFGHKIASTADDQLGELADSFNSMTGSIEDLLEQAAEKKRLEEELRIAHEIQMSLLPQGPLQLPGISLTALCVPAREVGGDYYDFLPIDEHRLGILIADVSGKGTSAALYMAELKGLVLSLSRIHTSPRALLIDANRIIAKHLDARSFITITYAVIDVRARTMTYARAGHTPLLLLPAGDGVRPRRARILVPGGMVLGLKLDEGEMFEKLLEEDVVPLRPGDLYLFFTDGITEAMNADDDFFGEARLGRLLEEHAHLPPDELRERVLREIAAFVGSAPQHDDMTMILLRVDDLESVSPADASIEEAMARSA